MTPGAQEKTHLLLAESKQIELLANAQQWERWANLK
jgi:hypothetical protein